MRAYYFFMKYIRGFGIGFVCAAAVIFMILLVLAVLYCVYFL